MAIELYTNFAGKMRIAYPPDVRISESANRYDFITGFIPTIVQRFAGYEMTDVNLRVVGSVALQQAGPDSDIDVLVLRLPKKSSEVMELVNVGSQILQEIEEKRESPYRIEFWYQCPDNYDMRTGTFAH